MKKFADKHDLNVINSGENTHVTHSNGTESTLDVTIASAALDGDLCNHYPGLIRLMDRLEEQTRRPMSRIKCANWDKYKNKTQAEVENNEFSDAESFTTMMIKCAKK
jgi:hypothetical protein